MGVVKERLVLPDRLALVVEDRPAAADPARADPRPTVDERTGLGLDLLLDLAAEAVGIAQADLDLESAGRERIAGVGFARERGCEDGLLRCAIPIQVVHDASGGLSQEERGVAQRIGQEVLTLLRGQIRHESRQGVALGLGHLSHDGGPGHQPQRVEGHLGAVAVGVGHPKRLEEAVIVFGGRAYCRADRWFA